MPKALVWLRRLQPRALPAPDERPYIAGEANDGTGGNMARQFRRIVTTNDANGKSEVLLDGQPTKAWATILTDMWVTGPGRHDHADRKDHATDSKGLEPPKGGTVFRYFTLPPISAFAAMTDAQRDAIAAQMFAAMNAGHARKDVSKNPTMHQTELDGLHRASFRAGHAGARQGRTGAETLRRRHPARHKPRLDQHRRRRRADAGGAGRRRSGPAR